MDELKEGCDCTSVNGLPPHKWTWKISRCGRTTNQGKWDAIVGDEMRSVRNKELDGLLAAFGPAKSLMMGFVRKSRPGTLSCAVTHRCTFQFPCINRRRGELTSMQKFKE